MANYSAQNMGYGDIKRIREGFKATTIIGCVYSIFAMLFAIFVGKHLTHMFVSDDVDIIMNGVDTYLKCVSPFFVPLAIVNIYRNGIQGLGFSILPMFAGIAELIGRAIAAVVAGHMKSYIGICLAHPLAWILASILLIVMYYYIMNNKINDMISKNKISNVA